MKLQTKREVEIYNMAIDDCIKSVTKELDEEITHLQEQDSKLVLELSEVSGKRFSQSVQLTKQRILENIDKITSKKGTLIMAKTFLNHQLSLLHRDK